MGHCLSCWKNQQSSSNYASHKKRNDEKVEVISQITVAAAEHPHEEPLLYNNENHMYLNHTTNHTTQNANVLHSSSIEQATEPPCISQHISEKASKPFYEKLPITMPLLGSGDTRVSDSKIKQLFDLYKDSLDDAILAEGIENLCNDLQLNPDDFKVLVLAWKLNASQMCRFTRTEFTEGLKNMKTDSIKGIQQKLNEITNGLKCDSDQFKDLYRFTFKFGLDVSSGQRILPIDIAIVLWRLVFTNNVPTMLERWLNFLEKSPHVRGIPKDTWYMFLNFCEFVGNDLSTYDDTEAWPSLFDDFVESENDQANQNFAKSDYKLQD